MTVYLADLVPSLRREVSPPGEDLFPNATDNDLVDWVVDGFWEAVLDGLIQGYDSTVDGQVTPLDAGGDDLPREMQQLIVLYAGIRIVRNHLRNLNTTFRAKAGEVEYEIQNSASVLKALLDELRDKRQLLLKRHSDVFSTPSYYFDGYAARTESLRYDDIDFIGG